MSTKIDYRKIKFFHHGEVYEFTDPAKVLAARKRSMIRPSDIARELNVPKNTVRRWESETKSIPQDKFEALCKLLRARPSELRPT